MHNHELKCNRNVKRSQYKVLHVYTPPEGSWCVYTSSSSSHPLSILKSGILTTKECGRDGFKLQERRRDEERRKRLWWIVVANTRDHARGSRSAPREDWDGVYEQRPWPSGPQKASWYPYHTTLDYTLCHHAGFGMLM
uniref:Uncharacterized protein n=1 Tax=Lactuca sativa TaxID=4236 RepID=A0A9R1X6Y7_LACSA|nr:hypothetical protein LSAT_V11C600332100 [Lactuca sativa]